MEKLYCQEVFKSFYDVMQNRTQDPTQYNNIAPWVFHMYKNQSLEEIRQTAKFEILQNGTITHFSPHGTQQFGKADLYTGIFSTRDLQVQQTYCNEKNQVILCWVVLSNVLKNENERLLEQGNDLKRWNQIIKDKTHYDQYDAMLIKRGVEDFYVSYNPTGCYPYYILTFQ